MNNQGNYQQYRSRLPPPPPFQQAGTSPYFPPVSVPPPSGTLTPGQPYVSWSQGQHILPLIPPGHHQTPRIPPPGQQFYRVPPPRLPPPPSSSYFTPAPPGPFVQPPPPPPPPSSPPPGPPPLPPSSPPFTSNSHLNGSETSVKETPDFNILSGNPPPPPKDEKTIHKIELLCQYISKNGQEFEEMTLRKEAGNPDYEFLSGGAPGSEAAIAHEYFKWMKRKCQSDELLKGGHDRDLALKPSVVGKDISHSPASSDMDMEDDITQAEDSEKHQAAVISSEVDIKAENNAYESPTAIERGPNLSLDDDTQFEKSKITVGVEDSILYSDCKTEQDNINLYENMNQSEQSPFKLLQGYASDDTSENDNDLHFENVSPVAVSPQVKDYTTPPVSVVDGSMNTSKVLEPSTETENLENRTDGDDSRKRNLDDDGTVRATSPKNVGAEKEDNNVKLEIDEFGRAVKVGGGDSDSDDYSTRRRVKRGRNRSRSRSPYERSRSRSYGKRRRRSPRRRREKRSPSRSWSPKKRGRSRSPYNRRNKSQSQEICHDFRLGRCFRGATCRYLHEPVKSEESRWHKNKHYDHKVSDSDRLKNSNKLVPEKDEAGYHTSRSNDGFKEESLEVEPPGQSAEVASGHEIEYPANETAITGQITTSGHPLNQTSQPELQLASEYNLMPPATTSATLWNSLPLPPPPPRPQFSRPLLPYQLNQPPFPTNYPFRPFVAPPYGTQVSTPPGVYPMNYPIPQQPVGPTILSQDNYVRMPSPNLVSSNSREPPAGINAVQSFLQNPVADIISDLGRSRLLSHYNPYASTFDQPPSTKFSSGVFNQDCGTSGNQNQTPGEGQTRNDAHNPPRSGGDQYDPLFDSIDRVDPISNPLKKSDAVAASEENDEFGETADAEVGAVENDSPSPSSPIDLPVMATGEVEIDQVKNTKSKDSRSMKLFKIALADFVKEVLKPSWRQGNMSKEAFKTIVKKTVDKVAGAMKKHQIPKSQAKINHYIDSSQRKLTKLVMGYVDKYVKV